MNAIAHHRLISWESWALAAEADRRFRRIVVAVAIPAILLAILIALFHVEMPHHDAGEYSPERYAQLLPAQEAPKAEQNEEPKPAQKNEQKTEQASPKPAEKQKPQEKPTPAQPTPEQRIENARQKAANTQEMQALRDQLADLRDQTINTNSATSLTTTGAVTSKGSLSGGSGASAFAQAAGQGSGGIGSTGAGSVSQSQSGTGLGERRTTTVQGPPSGKKGTGGFPAEKLAGGRTLEEIQQAFDRNKAAFYAIFGRAARENPAIGSGKIIVALTIAPDGSVTNCRLVSSNFGDAELERKIVERVKLINFGAKNVPPFTYPNYPINYNPG